MPSTLSYPGVYIEEISSGVRTITGVATSITAFVGRTRRGPVNDPITINGFADFERIFGGLWELSPLSFAVRDFYLNGGSQAVIVRLYGPFFPASSDEDEALAAAQGVADAANTAALVVGATAQDVADAARAESDTVALALPPPSAAATAADAVADAADAAAAVLGATPATVNAVTADAVAPAAPITRARLSVDTLDLAAAYPGAWGNGLRARVDHDVTGTGATDLFNLSVRDADTLNVETFRNVSVLPNHKRNVARVLEGESKLVRTLGTLPGARPAPNAPSPIGVVPSGGDPFSTANSSGVTGQASDGNDLVGADYTGSEAGKTGMFALEKTDLFNILCVPPYSFAQDVEGATWAAAASYCERRRAMLVVDSPGAWVDKDAAKGDGSTTGIAGLGTTTKNGAVFFPRLRQPNPLHDNQLETFAPCGAVAGVFARTDTQRGVWKAPAGLDATLVGVPQLSVSLTDAENGELNPLGINCLRTMVAAGRVVWGARTLQGDDRNASEWKYIPVRRLALFLEESLFRGTKWVVFEPNDEPLWAQIRLNLGAFMHNLFRQGAFQGMTPKDAYFVKCDKETTTQNDINLGIVNIVVGFAPLKPAEFVVIKIQQMAGQIET
jgi:phage tail sheath protein FI